MMDDKRMSRDEQTRVLDELVKAGIAVEAKGTCFSKTDCHGTVVGGANAKMTWRDCRDAGGQSWHSDEPNTGCTNL